MRARLFFIFFLHDFPFVVFIGGDFAEFQTIPEGVGEVKMGLGVGCGGGFGALKVLDVKVVIVFIAAVVVTWIAAAYVATGVENFARVLLFFFFFVIFMKVSVKAHVVVVDVDLMFLGSHYI